MALLTWPVVGCIGLRGFMASGLVGVQGLAVFEMLQVAVAGQIVAVLQVDSDIGANLAQKEVAA